MLEELNSKMVKDGKIVPFEKFKKEALKLNNQYNINHLQAEYDTANHSAKMASFWETAVKNKERFPNLKFKTQEDNRVSDEHRKLNDIIAAIDSDFWKTHYPPLRFRCRCYALQTAADVSDKIPKVDIPPEFKNNVALTKEIFSEEKHPFFQLAKRGIKGRQNLQEALENSKNYAPKYTIKTPKERVVKVSMFADLTDLLSNIKTGTTATDVLGKKVEINPHKKGQKNPELKFDDVIGDKVVAKSKIVKNSITNAFNDKLKKQGQLRDLAETFIVIDLDNYQASFLKSSLVDAAKQVNAKIKHYKNVKTCYFEYKGKMVNIEKSDNFETILEKLNELI
jgi:SPP1 gp7 family putative phage head morphogenesis protein